MSQEKFDSKETGGEVIGTQRRRELDVLTTLIVFGLGFFHTASIFSGHQLIANKMQNELTTIVASLVVASEFIWIMPVMMLVAGIAAWHSLERRTPTRFLRERLLRLGLGAYSVPCSLEPTLVAPVGRATGRSDRGQQGHQHSGENDG